MPLAEGAHPPPAPALPALNVFETLRLLLAAGILAMSCREARWCGSSALFELHADSFLQPSQHLCITFSDAERRH